MTKTSGDSQHVHVRLLRLTGAFAAAAAHYHIVRTAQHSPADGSRVAA